MLFSTNTVCIKSEDDKVVDSKGIGRKVIDKLLQTYCSELDGKDFAYDGEKCLFTVGPLPQNNFEFTVILEETSSRAAGGSPVHESPTQANKKRVKRSHLAKKFSVDISYAAKIPLQSVALALRGSESEHGQDVLRVLDVVLRQQQAKRGCLLVRQSFFSDDSRNLVDLTGGVSGCRGLHSSFRTTIGGLSLNMDVSTTMVVTPGPVIDFLVTNQNVRDIRDIDWPRAKKMLKNLRVKAKHNNMEFKIIGLSDQPCSRQMFPMKVRNGNIEIKSVDITVQDYFKSKQVELTMPYLPCLDVGKPKRPNYLPIELCHMVSLQRYTKALSSQQRAMLVEKSRQKPQERMRVVTDAVKSNMYDDDPILSSCGIEIEKQLTRVDARVLSAPALWATVKIASQTGRLFDPVKIERWAIVNFSARCDMSRISRELINCGRSKGIFIECPHSLVDEDSQSRRCSPVERVEKMFEKVKASLPGPPEFLLCLLPERKNCDIYGPWKKKNLHEMGIVTQCIAPSNKMNDQYFTNVLLKINAKLGGMNSKLALEHRQMIPVVTQIPTLILGMDVSHGSPGRADIPSIAAVVGSRCWPLISRYRASVRTQSPKVEMIDSLFKPLDDGKDDGIMRELLLDFYQTSQQRKPKQIIIFRDGVSESQFSQVLNVELNQIIKAYQSMGQGDLPKFTVIIAQKNHHTKLFQADSPENVPPGTVVDSGIVHPRQYDFYMCAHAGPIGTSRPTHYHVLLDEIGFSADNLQKLVLSLSYVYQRSTTAISVVAPICYAHLAAAQMGQFMKFEEFADTSSGSVNSSSPPSIPELPRLHADVCSSMFFC
uniref:Argonaute6 n=1 Tax=Zea mays TaxID=4577 RepID=A0A804Q7B5_MAIZE